MRQFIARFKRLGAILWNAAFTRMGRQNVSNRYKLKIAEWSAEWRRGEPMPYKLADGTRFVVHRGNSLSQLIYAGGAYEPFETGIVRSVLGRGDAFLDIGANVGYFTAIAADAVGPSGQVHSFEPGPGTFVELQKTIGALGLGNVTANNVAVADKAGALEFWTSMVGGDAQQSLKNVTGLQGNAQAVSVQAITLDGCLKTWTPDQLSRLTMVKCDVEGAELLVLDGAKALMQGTDTPLWLIEHNRPALSELGFSSNDLCGRFAEYTLFYVPLNWPPSVCTVETARPVRGPENLPDECNILAIPKRGKNAVWLERLAKGGIIECQP